MTRGEYLKQATAKLTSSFVPTSRLDALLIMEFALDTDRAKILASLADGVSPEQKNVLNILIDQRAKHWPIAYITRSSEFYGRSFYVDKNVLVPRPESETMIELLKKLLSQPGYLKTKAYQPKNWRLADVGCGSGALGITAALELGKVTVDLIDVDQKALNVARRNVVLHTITANLIKDDLLAHNTKPYDVLLCNLPYVPDNFQINLAAAHEPPIAIFGGTDGLDIYRKLFKLLSNRQHRPLYILLEALPPQHAKLQALANPSGYTLKGTDDFIQLYSL